MRRGNLKSSLKRTLCMDWFPSHITERVVKDENPDGAAVIELDVNRRQWESIVFVGGQTYADGIMFRHTDATQIIQWVEDETGLKHGKQFELIKEVFEFNKRVQNSYEKLDMVRIRSLE